jgi:hypothetical protein
MAAGKFVGGKTKTSGKPERTAGRTEKIKRVSRDYRQSLVHSEKSHKFRKTTIQINGF